MTNMSRKIGARILVVFVDAAFGITDNAAQVKPSQVRSGLHTKGGPVIT